MVKNNIVSDATSREHPNTLYFSKKQRCNDALLTASDHNAFHRSNPSLPSNVVYHVVVVVASCNDHRGSKTLADFQKNFPFDDHSIEVSGDAITLFVDEARGDYRLKASAAIRTKGAPVPEHVAPWLGVAAGKADAIGAFQP